MASINLPHNQRLDYAVLPDYIAGWDVALLPFALNDATRFISPTTTPEYLAAGRRVISTTVHDVIRGEIVFEHNAIDDFVIARSDGSPLYNLAVAVDDRDMGITHVIRGADHISNTPRQLMILEALGAQPPVFAHLPLLHGPDGKKLSKRHGAASVQELRSAGYLPEAVDNYIAMLGAGFASDEEHFSLSELAERFRLILGAGFGGLKHGVIVRFGDDAKYIGLLGGDAGRRYQPEKGG